MSPLLELARPRTLPLAVAAICCGNALAYQAGRWRPLVFLLALLTALALQILSNVANDYGDGLRGTDRQRAPDAPRRLTATGTLSPAQMRRLLGLWLLLCLLSGGALLAVSAPGPGALLAFLGLGTLAILAALTYTLGRRPYGYRARGEISVFLFFGLLAVSGSCYLQCGHLPPALLLPASGGGLLAAAVLNLNNIRDSAGDRAVGKHTLANQLGFDGARRLQRALLATAGLCYLAYGPLAPASLLWLLLLPLGVRHWRALHRAPTPAALGRELPAMVALAAGVNLLFSLGLWASV